MRMLQYNLEIISPVKDELSSHEMMEKQLCQLIISISYFNLIPPRFKL